VGGDHEEVRSGCPVELFAGTAAEADSPVGRAVRNWYQMTSSKFAPAHQPMVWLVLQLWRRGRGPPPTHGRVQPSMRSSGGHGDGEGGLTAAWRLPAGKHVPRVQRNPLWERRPPQESEAHKGNWRLILRACGPCRRRTTRHPLAATGCQK